MVASRAISSRRKVFIGLAAVVAVMAALAVGILAISVFPNGLSTTNTLTTTTPAPSTTYTNTAIATNTATITTTPIPTPIPKALMGELSAQDVSCSLASGVCTLTIVNNSTVPLELETCDVVVIVSSNVSSSATVTEYSSINGTIGGPATAGMPANSQVTATCTVPATQLAHQTEGSLADGTFMVKLDDSWYSYPAGTETGFSFEGTWS